MSRKPSPGVCGVCGCPVVRTEREIVEDGTYNGHTYEYGRLVRVRCKKHEPRSPGDDNMPEAI